MRLPAKWFTASPSSPLPSPSRPPSLAQSAPIPYGAPVTTETAKKAAAAALAEARKNGWNVAAAVVEPGGVLAYFEKHREHPERERRGVDREGAHLGGLPPAQQGLRGRRARRQGELHEAARRQSRSRAACRSWWTGRSSAPSA